MTLQIDYSQSKYPIRKDLLEAHQMLFDRFTRGGTWWDGAERLAIATEARAAHECELCAERKAALSPFSVEGTHAGPGELAPEIVDVIHRIITDPGRLAKSWYERVMSERYLSEERYVELVSVTVLINALDVFALAIGLDRLMLSEPTPGAPTKLRPATARIEGAWVPQIPAGEEGGEDWTALYGDRDYVPQIGRALSLVPDEVMMLNALSGAHYMVLDHVSDPTYSEPDRSLDRLQMELVASRVSAINECFY
jgi:alkylhydroperoxidase family enzyme